MNYTIIETHCVYQDDRLVLVAVLWDDNGCVRATYSTLNPKAGYVNLTTNDSITPELFQKVAGGGSYLDKEQKARFFPGKRKWSK